MIPVLTGGRDAGGRPAHHRGARPARGRADGERGRGRGARPSRARFPGGAPPPRPVRQGQQRRRRLRGRAASPGPRAPGLSSFAPARRRQGGRPRPHGAFERSGGRSIEVSPTRRPGRERCEALLERADVVVDALLGTGLESAPDGLVARVIARRGRVRRRERAAGRGRGRPFGPLLRHGGTSPGRRLDRHAHGPFARSEAAATCCPRPATACGEVHGRRHRHPARRARGPPARASALLEAADAAAALPERGPRLPQGQLTATCSWSRARWGRPAPRSWPPRRRCARAPAS